MFDFENSVFEYDCDPIVLIIDDSTTACQNTSSIMGYFSEVGSNLLFAKSAKTGFDLLLHHKDTIKIVFVDLIMPKVDGLECLVWIKDNSNVAHIPVYILSTDNSNSLETEMLCSVHGAVHVLTKPLQYEEIKSIFQLHDLISIDHDVNTPQDPFVSSVFLDSYAPAFRLVDSAFMPFTFPDNIQSNSFNLVKSSLLLVFLPTIFLPSLYARDGIMTALLNAHHDLLVHHHCHVVCISGDLPHTLDAAKRKHNMPFRLLSDPSLTVCRRFAGTSNHTSPTSHATNDHSPSSSLCRHIVSNTALLHVDRSRRVLHKWSSGAGADRSPTSPTPTPTPPFRNLAEWIHSSSSSAGGVDRSHAVETTTILHKSVVKNTKIIDPSMVPPLSASPPRSCRPSSHLLRGAGRTSSSSTAAKSDAILPHILLLEDSSVSSLLAAQQLQGRGYVVTVVYHAQHALDLLRREARSALLTGEAALPFSLLIVDVVMPVCDGIELLTVLRAGKLSPSQAVPPRRKQHPVEALSVTDLHLEENGQNDLLNQRVASLLSTLPVVVLSGLVGDELTEQCLEMGARAVLAKPFDVDRFEILVRELHC